LAYLLWMLAATARPSLCATPPACRDRDDALNALQAHRVCWLRRRSGFHYTRIAGPDDDAAGQASQRVFSTAWARSRPRYQEVFAAAAERQSDRI
jgi:hypothetical protein